MLTSAAALLRVGVESTREWGGYGFRETETDRYGPPKRKRPPTPPMYPTNPISGVSTMPPRSPVLVVFLGTIFLASATSPPPPLCSRSCAALNCDSVGIRYGKYCGVGWSGCDGEEPCDDLDACCRDHDHCVDKKGETTTPKQRNQINSRNRLQK
ncbi:hypothetical protein GUJ93_ZPchr0002g24063 [Zizania palustris]|uniref:Uncharacterized protein n=1 Tax=Zizania palustris TaxID=103762 RepID=A0A8J5SCU5_ZIZPA|nr:hypothetical protein GUJ93_ZPchr0002g24063 [Zizania palustris]